MPGAHERTGERTNDRTALSSVGKNDKSIAIAALGTAFDVASLGAAKEQWGKLIEAFTPRRAKRAELMVSAEDDVLA